MKGAPGQPHRGRHTIGDLRRRTRDALSHIAATLDVAEQTAQERTDAMVPGFIHILQAIQRAQVEVARVRGRLFPTSEGRGGVVRVGADATQMESDAR